MRSALVVFVALITRLEAHDMWIEPTTFFASAGQIVGAKLRVGQEMLGDPLPRTASLVNQFIFEDGEGRKTLVGREGADPAGYLRVASPGLLVVGYFSNPSPVELDAAKFNQYLKDEGLDGVAEWRARHGQTSATGREIFTRCAKSLVLSGQANPKQGDRALGFTLELVTERNPYALRPGEDLPLRLMYRDRPLAGALVVARNRLNPTEKLSARTDAAGRVHFRLKPEGMWMIKAVHMIREPEGAAADWASYWASLTFELRADALARN